MEKKNKDYGQNNKYQFYVFWMSVDVIISNNNVW